MALSKSFKTFSGEQDGYQTLLKFGEREGHCIVPTSYIEGDFELGLWVQRCRIARKQNNISPKLANALEALPGWYWSAHDAKWMVKFELLKKFVAREGHAMVPQFHLEDSEKLGSWVAAQKTRREKLSEERLNMLDGVPGWIWSTRHGSARNYEEKSFQAASHEPVQEQAGDIYELLAQRSSRSFDGYDAPKALPEISIPGELVYFLDDLIDLAYDKLKMAKSDAMADVIDQGIVAWYKKNTGLSVKEPLEPIEPQVSPESLELQSLKAEIAEIKRQRDDLKIKLDEMYTEEASKETMPTKVQENQYGNGDDQGYTPLTSHCVTEPWQKGKSKRFG